MKMYTLRHVKREIRVLGLAVKPARADHQYHAVGIVYRGRLWLDGVMRTTAQGPEITKDIIEMIKGSPHHAQIRVVLLDGDLMCQGAAVDPVHLSRGTSRPVIAIGFEEAGHPPEEVSVHQLDIRRGDTSLPTLLVGLKERVATRILETSSRDNMEPEALRVAGLAVSALSKDGHT